MIIILHFKDFNIIFRLMYQPRANFILLNCYFLENVTKHCNPHLRHFFHSFFKKRLVKKCHFWVKDFKNLKILPCF